MAQETDRPQNQDFISGLPEDVKVKILEYLSLDEAVRSSVLSKSWRYTWSNITKLDIDAPDFGSHDSVIDFIEMFFLLHNGSIFEFVFDRYCVPQQYLGDWLSILSRRNIQSFKILDTNVFGTPRRPIEIPSDFYFCHSLEIVYLESCVMDVPFTFDGFKLLKTLSLVFVVIDSASFERLISNCPLLEMLEIEDSLGSDCFKIRAPNLKVLLIRVEFAELYLDVPSLVHADFQIYDVASSNLSYVLSRVPNIEKLNIDSYHLEEFNIENSLEKRSIKFNNLIEISIDINVWDHHDVSFALFFFEKSPNFQTLRLKMRSSTSEAPDVISLLESKLNDGSVFTKLTTMYLHGSAGDKLVMAFLKFVILTAPLLKKVSFSESLWKYKGNCLKLMKLHGLSNTIEIILLQDY